MRKAAIISACVHALVIALIYFGLPTLFEPKQVEEQPVPVDIVSLQDVPTAAKPPPPPKVKPAKPAPPPETEKPPPPPPPPPEPPKAEPAPATPPPPKAEALPLPKEKPKPTPKPKPEPKPKPQQQASIAPPAPLPKRKPKPPPDQFQALLKNLAKEKAQEQKAEKKPEKKPPPKKSEPFDVSSLVKSLQTPQRSSIDKRRMGANLAQMVQQQITPCWSIPGGAKDVRDMKIAVHIQLNQDGTLRGAPRLEDTRRLQTDPFYRAVAESALRALRNPTCSPLKLPLDQYDLWQDITFVFEPGEALGQ